MSLLGRGVLYTTFGWWIKSPGRVDPGCWLRSGFESPRGQLVVSLFQDLISYGRFTGATLYVPCLDWGLINYIHFLINIALKKHLWNTIIGPPTTSAKDDTILNLDYSLVPVQGASGDFIKPQIWPFYLYKNSKKRNPYLFTELTCCSMFMKWERRANTRLLGCCYLL